EVELKEKKHRIEDAVQAARAAVEEGVVPGGGVALLRAQTAIDKMRGGTDDEKAGRSIVRKAMEEPLRQIAVNAGFEGGVVVERVRAASGNEGFNAATGVYGDLVADGVIDPAKVTRSTLQNAASIAALLLTTEALVAEEKELTPAMPGGGHGHDGGGGMDF
ncbi:MAG: TCP-1/cpn60 chaperonin family protein, partial [Acidimicrobiia bacterium]